MNYFFLCVNFIFFIFASYVHPKQCAIILEPQWINLDRNCKEEKFGGKWILIGNITFKKRCKDPICMTALHFHWNGLYIDNLVASLYKKNSQKDSFLPLEENLICDGIWNKEKQILIFDFNEEKRLSPTTVFYLVLTIPKTIESILKKGHFSLENNILPDYFKQQVQKKELILAINES